ncbi:MAG: hypothetical protein HN909_07755 [Phycisphaerales bacterium]|jgi:hypothetical protein|nr:hypothetical protein [Phycisphaerales bacterium]MBT7171649.1 hypothetical protein [Phycisphaerales bacterium]
MTAEATIVSVRPAAQPGQWALTFESSADEAYHQLYLDGEIADVTNTPAQRTFLFRATSAPTSASVRACSWADRHRAESLPPPDWHHRHRVMRRTCHLPGERVELLCDDGLGGDYRLADSATIWDETHLHWGFGQGQLGRGGFGIDGDLAPGFGRGAFGAGAFGFDAEEISLRLCAPRSGLLRIRLQTRNGDSLSEPIDSTLAARVAPASLAAIAPTAYDPATQHLTLEVSHV